MAPKTNNVKFDLTRKGRKAYTAENGVGERLTSAFCTKSVKFEYNFPVTNYNFDPKVSLDRIFARSSNLSPVGAF